MFHILYIVKDDTSYDNITSLMGNDLTIISDVTHKGNTAVIKRDLGDWEEIKEKLIEFITEKLGEIISDLAWQNNDICISIHPGGGDFSDIKDLINSINKDEAIKKFENEKIKLIVSYHGSENIDIKQQENIEELNRAVIEYYYFDVLEDFQLNEEIALLSREFIKEFFTDNEIDEQKVKKVFRIVGDIPESLTKAINDYKVVLIEVEQKYDNLREEVKKVSKDES